MRIITSNTARLFVLILALLNVLTGGHVNCCAPLHVLEFEHQKPHSHCCSGHHSHGHSDDVFFHHACECNSDGSDHEHYCAGVQPVVTLARVSDDDLLYKPLLDWCFSDILTDGTVVLQAPHCNEFDNPEKHTQSLRLHALYGVLLI